MDEAFFDAFLYSDLEDLCIAFFGFAFDVLASRFDAEFPWSFDACIFFKTVVASAVVTSDNFKVCLRADLLERGESFPRFGVVEEELDMDSSILSFLELSVDVSSSGVLPLLQVGLYGGSVGVV